MRALFFIAALLCLSGCKKSYEFSGIIYDATTGKPLKDAACRLKILNEISTGTELILESTDNTDSTGAYYLSLESSKADIGYFDVEKYGYITYVRKYEGRTSEDRDIYMYKLDSYLEISFANNSTTETRRAYYGLNYEPLGSIVTCDVGPCAPTVGPGQTKKVLEVVPGGLDVNIYWRDRAFYLVGVKSEDVNITKIFCTRGDTTRITIPF